jgi:hypothetical protein
VGLDDVSVGLAKLEGELKKVKQTNSKQTLLTGGAISPS